MATAGQMAKAKGLKRSDYMTKTESLKIFRAMRANQRLAEAYAIKYGEDAAYERADRILNQRKFTPKDYISEEEVKALLKKKKKRAA